MTSTSIDTAEAEMSVEARSEARHRVFLRGHITFNQGATSLDCLVRDLSPSGARLEFSEAVTLPEVFDLHILQKARTLRATLSWRRGADLGVTFSGEPSLTPGLVSAIAESARTEGMREALLDRISELEAENVALRRMLHGMTQLSGVP